MAVYNNGWRGALITIDKLMLSSTLPAMELRRTRVRVYMLATNTGMGMVAVFLITHVLGNHKIYLLVRMIQGLKV